MSRRHWVTPFLLSYIHRYISFAEVGRICRAVLREPMHLCTCVSEKGGDGEAACSETPSPVIHTYTRYDFFVDFMNLHTTILFTTTGRCIDVCMVVNYFTPVNQ